MVQTEGVRTFHDATLHTLAGPCEAKEVECFVSKHMTEEGTVVSLRSAATCSSDTIPLHASMSIHGMRTHIR